MAEECPHPKNCTVKWTPEGPAWKRDVDQDEEVPICVHCYRKIIGKFTPKNQYELKPRIRLAEDKKK